MYKVNKKRLKVSLNLMKISLNFNRVSSILSFHPRESRGEDDQRRVR